MDIVVMGTGAMGSIYAALLADAGHQVRAIDIWQEHIAAIQANGLRVEGASGDRTVSVDAASDIDGIDHCDLVIIATKASAVGSAVQAVQPLLGPDTVLLTIQNGLGAAERIAEHHESDNVLLGVAQGFGASIRAPGHVHHTSMSLIRIGASQPGHKPGVAATVERITRLWQDAGFNAASYQDINQLIWEKFICNVAYSAPCTVVNCTIAELMADSDAVILSRQCAIEAFEVARAKKIRLSFDDPIDYVTQFGKALGDARPSMLLDHLARRPSEIDAINGMVPIVAQDVDLEAPCNQTLARIVRAREAALGRET